MCKEIYVKEKPKSPDDCPCNYDTFCNVLCDGINCWSKIREDCPLIDIKAHDRELVKKVCEKIKRKVDNISMHTATKERLMLMCEEIKKELEGEE